MLVLIKVSSSSSSWLPQVIIIWGSFFALLSSYKRYMFESVKPFKKGFSNGTEKKH